MIRRIVRLIGFKKPHFSPKFMISILDEKGKVIKTRRCMTMTKTGIGMMGNMFCEIQVPGMRDTSNNVFTSFNPGSAGAYVTAVGSLGVGTSTAAFAVDAPDLTTPILNGSTSGKLVYGSVTAATAVGVSGTTASMLISQVFTNNSGADITVNEVALYANWKDNASGGHTVMIDRTLITFTVPNTGARTVQYTFSNQ